MARTDIQTCEGMREDGTCGNGCNVENHNKPCVGKNCPHRFGEYVERNKRGSIIGGGYIQPGNVRPSVTAMPVPAANYRERVSEQYRTVCAANINFFQEVAKFGSLLMEVEGFICEGRGRGNSGEGLKGWLAENCPDVNYNTAYGYKAMAAKVAKMIGGGVQAIACLQGRETVVEPASQAVVNIDPTFIEKRDALFEKVESRRQLEQLWFEFCGEREKKRPGRPVGSKAQTPKVDTNNPTLAARAEWSRVIAVAAQNDAALRAAARLLTQEDVENGLTILRTLTDYLKEREAELKR